MFHFPVHMHISKSEKCVLKQQQQQQQQQTATTKKPQKIVYSNLITISFFVI